MNAVIGTNDYPVAERHQIDNSRMLILFRSHLEDGSIESEILGKEICLFDVDGRFLWKINPAPGSTVGYDRVYNPNSTELFDFVHLFCNDGNYFAERYNGDVFEIDLKDGTANYVFWKKS
ncbi:hypothetical protein [Novosphingobium sp. PhB55]|uniref:hypothetical protein n=1 Tax=Novosphingobium sp. PhB55 TaxID=2485106 RepID=UPI0010647CAC|nr:hypothetical protein [Novosphingobium sp. PhB55]